jgi:hypothetical protein
MSETYCVRARGYSVLFYVYVNVAVSAFKVVQLERFLARMPNEHLRLGWPFFVMLRKPGGRNRGGTWTPNGVRTSVMGGARSRNTGTSDEDIERLVPSRELGMLGLSEDRWRHPMGRLEFTVIHEVAHCIDFQLGLVPAGATDATFQGMETDRCGPGSTRVRRAVEAYARWICGHRHIFHTPVPRERPWATNARLIAALRSSPAFANVPESWEPGP